MDLAERKAMTVPEGCLGLVRVAKGCTRLANEVHLLPCCINYNGPAPVSDYFRPKITEGVQVKEAFFRGRKLLGCTMELPHDYFGFALEKDITAESNVEAKKWDDSETGPDIWNAKAIFQDLTYWQHDDYPSSTDPVPKSLEWLHLASVMHKPVTAAEVTSMEQSGMLKESISGPKRKSGQV